MLLTELQIQEQSIITGSYICVKYTVETTTAIEQFLEKHSIPNPVHALELHTTLIYSDKPAEGYTPHRFDPHLQVTPDRLEMWDKSTPEEERKYLILLLDAPELIERHNTIMKDHNTNHSFPDYTPHITLSYNMENTELNSLPLPVFDVIATHEEHSPLHT